MSLRAGNFSRTSSQFVMSRKPRVVRFFPVLRTDYIGVSPTHPHLLALNRSSFKAHARFVTTFGRKLKTGVTKYALSMRKLMEIPPTESPSATVREEVRRRYGASASGKSACADGCCTSTDVANLGYSTEDVAAAPDTANLGLGCGNPLAIASLKDGQVVLDLGSGAGFDCFLAARAVGKTGKVIGVDMTHEMLTKARENAQKNGFTNVEFRLGEIEALPVADKSVDVIISNCVINLSPEKQRVFNEAFRVLKPGGRLAVADMVATAPLPDDIKADWAAYTGCISGASQVTELERMLHSSGFENIEIAPKDSSRSFIREWLPGRRIEDYVISATIEAVKPYQRSS